MNAKSKVVGGLAVLLAVAVASPIVAQEKEEKRQKRKRFRGISACWTLRRII